MGIEYAGKHTLGLDIAKWWAERTGEEAPPPGPVFHDHFTVPHVVRFGGAHDEHRELSAKQMLTLNPGLMEQYQRSGIIGRLSSGCQVMADLLIVDWYYSDAVCAPLYYGYGGPGQYANRGQMARGMDAQVNQLLPGMVIVHMKASPETIGRRVQEGERLPEQARGHAVPGEGHGGRARGFRGAVREFAAEQKIRPGYYRCVGRGVTGGVQAADQNAHHHRRQDSPPQPRDTGELVSGSRRRHG